MANSYELSNLSPESFENLVNFLAMKTLGPGLTGFGPGADGGRDGYFSGEAPYPSNVNRWSGIWYIQSKFHRPHLSTDAQKWLRQQAEMEINAFEDEESDRQWPDVWILATNIDASGVPETGSFDAIRRRLSKTARGKKVKLAIWGGRKILDLLASFPDVATYYGHFLTPGHILSQLREELIESKASPDEIIRYFVATQFDEHVFTKLDQAGSSADVRPAVHDLFIDLPFKTGDSISGNVLVELTSAAAQCHRYSLRKTYPEGWTNWANRLRRARVSLIKGGPGQGKSTIGQYLCQIHRANLILGPDAPKVNHITQANAEAIRSIAKSQNFWPEMGRVPIQIELKEYAHWFSQQKTGDTLALLAYLSHTISQRIGFPVLPKTLKAALRRGAWIVIFDGLDEVPNDYKDKVAQEVLYFLNDLLIELDADVLAVCTSRPQGYSGQFSDLDGPTIDLALLSIEVALSCADKLLAFRRSAQEANQSISILHAASESLNIRELMTTPLQSHIMAVVVRDGGRPPERRWQLFHSFYLVMKKREAQKNFPNHRIARLLREGDRLLKAVHMRLGFVLHARAEKSEGAQTTLNREEFSMLVREVVTELEESDIDQTVADLMEATTERLVLVSTPENGQNVRFDIRQLQEFFAAEFLYAGVSPEELAERIVAIGGDAHWREVMHFLISALVENNRMTDVAVAVQALRELNEGYEEETSLLYRRMATSGFLAARLLVEGVLEQSKSDRLQLKPLFDPLTGVLDLSSISFLAHLRPERSRHWLIQQMIEKVDTASPKEFAGALLLLGWRPLEIKSAEFNLKMKSAFYQLGQSTQEELLNTWVPSSDFEFDHPQNYKSSPPVSDWVIEVAVEGLKSQNWAGLKRRLVRGLLDLCLQQKDKLSAAFSANGLEPKIAAQIVRLLTVKVSRFETGNAISHGLVGGREFLHNWRNGAIPEELLEVNPKEIVDKSSGVFRLLAACLWFAQSRSIDSAQEIARLWRKGTVDAMQALPDYLLALVPIYGRGTHFPYSLAIIDEINPQLNLSDLTEAENVAKVVSLYETLHIENVGENPEKLAAAWKTFATELPKFAIEFIFDKNFVGGSVTFVPELVNLVKSHAHATLPFILHWGILKEYKQNDLLDFLIDFAIKNQTEKLSPSRMISSFNSFKLNFPRDLPLLTYLGPALVEFPSDEWHHGLRRTANVLADFGLSMEYLREIMLNEECSNVIRAGAAGIFWRYQKPWNYQSKLHVSVDLQEEFKIYRSLYQKDVPSWFVSAFIQGVLSSHSTSDKKAVRIAASLIEDCESGLVSKTQVAELINIWRERSNAPVTSKGLLAKWLRYRFP